jgi:hypothetical protein
MCPWILALPHLSSGEGAGVDELLPHPRARNVALIDHGFPSDRLMGPRRDKDVHVLVWKTLGAAARAEAGAFVTASKEDAALPVEIRDPDGRLRRILDPLRAVSEVP